MKSLRKALSFFMVLLIAFGAVACTPSEQPENPLDGVETFSLEEAIGFGVDEIADAQYNYSPYQSAAWKFEESYYQYIDVDYILTDTNMYELIREGEETTNLIVWIRTAEYQYQHFYLVKGYFYFSCNGNNYVSASISHIDLADFYQGA